MTLFPVCVFMVCVGTTSHFSLYFLSQKKNFKLSKCKFTRKNNMAQVKRMFNSWIRGSVVVKALRY